MSHTFSVTPTVSDICDRIEAEHGVTLDRETAQHVWDKATVNELGETPGVSERTQTMMNRIASDPAGWVGEAIGRGESVTEALEREDPTESARDMALGADTFQRVLRALDIRTVSSRDHSIRAHTMDDLDKAGNGLGRALVPELLRRAYMEGTRFGTGRFSANRFYASNSPLSDVLTPEFTMSAINAFRLRQPILNMLVAVETGVPQGVFKYVYIDEQASEEHMARVSQGAELPTAKLTVTDREGKVYQYGRALEVTDAAMRRSTIDMVRFHVARIGQRNQLNKEEVGADTLIAGDGNANTAATETDISTIGGVAGTVNSTPLFNFLGLFEETGQYAPTIALAPRATKTKIRNSTFGSADAPVFLGVNRVLSMGGDGPEEVDHPPLHARSYIPTGKALYVDATQALGLAFETGSQKTETDRYIKRLVNVVAISEVMGFWVIDANASRLFDVEN